MLTQLLGIASLIIEEYYPPIIIILLAGAFLTLKRNRFTLVLALALMVLLLPAMKVYYDQSRPCTSTGIAGGPGVPFACPIDGGMPSGHAASATLFALAALGSWWFFVFAPITAFIAFTRIYSGVHTLNQVAAGVAFGIIVYAFSLSIINSLITIRPIRKVLWLLRSTENRCRRKIRRVLAGI